MTPTQQELESYILFELEGTTYGVRSREVLHMEMLQGITPVPNAPTFVEGVVLSRGQVIPAVNLRVRFGCSRQPHTLRTRLLVVQARDRSIGLIVDSAREFRMIPPERIQSSDSAITGPGGKFLIGIANLDDRLVLLLDLQAVIDLVQIEADTEAEPAMAGRTERSGSMGQIITH